MQRRATTGTERGEASMLRRIPEPQHEDHFADTEAARGYAQEAGGSTRRYDAFLRRLDKLGIRGRFLDVGAGPGVLATRIAERYPEVSVTALEISDAMVELGREYVANKGLSERITYLQGDAQDARLLRSLGGFDLVYCTYTLHHFRDPVSAMESFLAAAGPAGHVYLLDLRRVWWLYWIPKRNGFLDSIRAAYRVPEAKAMFEGLGRRLDVKSTLPCLLEILVRPQSSDAGSKTAN
jgi:SAM-dependent methyltransferase